MPWFSDYGGTIDPSQASGILGDPNFDPRLAPMWNKKIDPKLSGLPPMPPQSPDEALLATLPPEIPGSTKKVKQEDTSPPMPQTTARPEAASSPEAQALWKMQIMNGPSVRNVTMGDSTLPPMPASQGKPAPMDPERLALMLQAIQTTQQPLALTGRGLVSRDVTGSNDLLRYLAGDLNARNFSLAEETRPFDPAALTASLAGNLAPTPEQKMAGLSMYPQYVSALSGAQKGNVEGQVAMGHLGVEQARVALEKLRNDYAFGPGRVDQVVTDFAKQNPYSSSGELVSLKDRLSGVLSPPPSTGTTPPLPGVSVPGLSPGQAGPPLPGSPATAAPPQGKPGGVQRSVWDDIEATLEDSRVQPTGQRDAAGRPMTNPRPIGEFLMNLDSAHPGFVRQNWAKILPFILDRYGQAAADEWLTKGNARRFFTQPTTEELARSAVVNLMREQAAQQGQKPKIGMRPGGYLGQILEKVVPGLPPVPDILPR